MNVSISCNLTHNKNHMMIIVTTHTSIYAGESSECLGGVCHSLGGLARWSVMNHVSLGQPLKDTTSPALVFGMPLKQASDVRATETPQLPSKKPIY